MKTTRIFSTLIGISFLGTALAFGFRPGQRETAQIDRQKVLVKVETVASETTERRLMFSGITRAARHAVLSFVVPARMGERPVEVGDRVEKGDILARLDVREFDNAVVRIQAEVAEITVRLDQAERDRRRFEALIGHKAAAAKDYEQAEAVVRAFKASLQAAEARLQEARRIRSEAELKAPFSGTITAVRLEPGEWADPGHPVVELVGDKSMELEVDVPETVIGLLSEGKRVDVRLPFLGGQILQGTVGSVARATLAPGRLFPVVVALDPAPGLTAGLTAELILTLRTEPKLMVPVGAVVNPGASQPSLFVVENNRARRLPVELESFIGDRVAVNWNWKAALQK